MSGATCLPEPLPEELLLEALELEELELEELELEEFELEALLLDELDAGGEALLSSSAAPQPTSDMAAIISSKVDLFMEAKALSIVVRRIALENLHY